MFLVNQNKQEILKKYKKKIKKIILYKTSLSTSTHCFWRTFSQFFLAIVIFSCIYMFIGKDFTPAKIDNISVDSPAEKAGLKKNDVIVSIDG